MTAWLGVAAVLLALALLVLVIQSLGKFVSIQPELSRKTVHVGMGLVCLSFPWLFHEKWPVFVLALIATSGLAAIRFIPKWERRFGSVLGGVERNSFGEFYFPIAVAMVFYLSGSDPLLFVIPVLTLTLADSVGALIGIRYGLSPYQTDEGFKSAEGSIAFFIVAFLSCHVPLLLFSGTGRAETLLISLTAGFVVMLLEAIAWRGQDNLIVPLGMFFLLRLFLPLDLHALGLRLAVIVGLVLLVVGWRKKTTLSDSAVLAAALSGYAIWAFGGWLWLAAPLILFCVYVWLPSFPAPARPVQNLQAVTRVMAGGFLWLSIARLTDNEAWLGPYLLCMAAHTGNIISARLRVVRPEMPVSSVVLAALTAPTILFGALWTAASILQGVKLEGLALIPLSVGISIAAFIPAWPLIDSADTRPRRWFSETCIAILASLCGIPVV